MSWTDDFSFLLKGVKPELIPEQKSAAAYSNYLEIYSDGDFPELDHVDLVILGVCESRRTSQSSISKGPDIIREKLYRLFHHGADIKIADIGNIDQGNDPTDTDYALTTILKSLLDHSIAAIILGGTQDLTVANYSAYQVLDTTVNVAVIDSGIDLGEFRDKLSPDNFLSAIVLHDEGLLFNLSILGYQTYLTDPDVSELMEKLFFDMHRLGVLSNDIRSTEPLLRNADMVSFDVNALRNDAAPGTLQPNGFSGEHACQIARYAGVSDKTTSIGFYNYNPDGDIGGQTAMLLAQMVWCAIEGFSYCQRESPLIGKSNFMEYKVHMPDGREEMLFYKSKRTDKWWMNVPYNGKNLTGKGRQHIVPCNYSDYELACTGDVPDMWWRTYQKLG